MANGGGTLFLGTSGREIGPGQVGIADASADVFTYHFYDGATGGAPTLGIRSLSWDAQGWPVAGDKVAASQFQ